LTGGGDWARPQGVVIAVLSFSVTFRGQSPKPEARSPKEIQNPKPEMQNCSGAGLSFGFRASFGVKPRGGHAAIRGSRISTFGFMLPQRLACLFSAALGVVRPEICGLPIAGIAS